MTDENSIERAIEELTYIFINSLYAGEVIETEFLNFAQVVDAPKGDNSIERAIEELANNYLQSLNDGEVRDTQFNMENAMSQTVNPTTGEVSERRELTLEEVRQKELLRKDKMYLRVPYEEKERAKELGARWDKDMKMFYLVSSQNPNQFMEFDRMLDKLTKEQAVAVEELGAEYKSLRIPRPDDPPRDGVSVSSWFIPKDMKANEFQEYLPEGFDTRKPVRLEPNNRLYAIVPFEDIDKARKIGAFKERGESCVHIPPHQDPAKFERFHRLINVPYEEKENAKANGAYWSRNYESFYVPAGKSLEPFQEWLPKGYIEKRQQHLEQEAQKNGPAATEKEHASVDAKERASADVSEQQKKARKPRTAKKQDGPER
jgi:hypothetical protein